MSILQKIRTAFRGEVSLASLPREALRRYAAKRSTARERRLIDTIAGQPARLAGSKHLNSFELTEPRFWEKHTATVLTDQQIVDVRNAADRIVTESAWEILGFGPLHFEGDFWRCDPLTGEDWGLDFHADIGLNRSDTDIRVLWELNRFGHAIPLALSYSLTRDEVYAETLFSHLDSWTEQNTYGHGANWTVAMEAALRAINVAAALDLCRSSSSLSGERLQRYLRFFDQHGRFIVDNSEFSFISTSNHYFSNVVGLFWIGTMFPELAEAEKWRATGWAGLLDEIDKQFLPDGANFEASTGYHRFVTEMVLYSFILAERTGISIDEDHLNKLGKMLAYLRGIIRADGRMPLIGDADGSQIIPIKHRDADEALYLLDLGTEFLPSDELSSTAFPDAGAYVMRDRDLYMHFNANDCGLNGRGSHAHNDALSIEVSAFGRPFIVDPGSYVYNLDLTARHRFRSTAYHSTVMIDGVEQNTTEIENPFRMGNEARPRVIEWHTDASRDIVIGEHYGYQRLRSPVTHRRAIEFDKVNRFWLVTDELKGNGEHDASFLFHLAPQIEVEQIDAGTFCLGDEEKGRLIIHRLDLGGPPTVSDGPVSFNYGQTAPALLVAWSSPVSLPFTARFLIISIPPGVDLDERLAEIEQLTDNSER